MATTAERIAVVETQVRNLDEKIDDLQVEVKSSHGDIKKQLTSMYDASCTQHAELATKIKDLEGFRMKWTYLVLGGIAVLGWVSGHIDALAAFLK
jgi:predicted  nucleic acid-binding Zn-ribbon protein